MSWESTAEYYRLANELVRERLGGLHSARLVLASVDFAEIEHLQVTGQWERAAELLAEAARSLEAGRRGVAVALHEYDAQGRRADPGRRLNTAAPPGRRDRHGGSARRAEHGRACWAPPSRWSRTSTAAGCKPWAHRARAAGRRAGGGPPRDLLRTLPRRGTRGVQAGLPGRHSPPGPGGSRRRDSRVHRNRAPRADAEDSPLPVFPTTRLHVEAAVERAMADRSSTGYDDNAERPDLGGTQPLPPPRRAGLEARRYTCGSKELHSLRLS